MTPQSTLAANSRLHRAHRQMLQVGFLCNRGGAVRLAPLTDANDHPDDPARSRIVDRATNSWGGW